MIFFINDETWFFKSLLFGLYNVTFVDDILAYQSDCLLTFNRLTTNNLSRDQPFPNKPSNNCLKCYQNQVLTTDIHYEVNQSRI